MYDDQGRHYDKKSLDLVLGYQSIRVKLPVYLLTQGISHLSISQDRIDENRKKKRLVTMCMVEQLVKGAFNKNIKYRGIF